MSDTNELFEVPADKVIRVNGGTSVVCKVGDQEVVFPQSQIEWDEDPEEGDPWEFQCPRWILEDRGLEYLVDDEA